MKNNLSTLWLSHLKDQKDKDNFKEYILNSSSIWDRLNYILDQKIIPPKASDYDSPSWSHYQADSNGYNRAIKDIKEILPLTIKQ